MTRAGTRSASPAFREAASHALIIAGVAYIALVWLRIVPYAPPVPDYGPMFDARGFWIAWDGGLYDIPWGEYEAYVYSPAFAQLLWPFTLLPWPVFAAGWTIASIGCLFWMRVPWMIAFPGVIDDILRGNIHVFLAASIVLALAPPGRVGIRHPHEGHAGHRPRLAHGPSRVASCGDRAGGDRRHRGRVVRLFRRPVARVVRPPRRQRGRDRPHPGHSRSR